MQPTEPAATEAAADQTNAAATAGDSEAAAPPATDAQPPAPEPTAPAPAPAPEPETSEPPAPEPEAPAPAANRDGIPSRKRWAAAGYPPEDYDKAFGPDAVPTIPDDEEGAPVGRKDVTELIERFGEDMRKTLTFAKLAARKLLVVAAGDFAPAFSSDEASSFTIVAHYAGPYAPEVLRFAPLALASTGKPVDDPVQHEIGMGLMLAIATIDTALDDVEDLID